MLLNLLILNIYLHVSESFNIGQSGQIIRKLPASTLQNTLCSSDSNAIHLFAIDKETVDQLSELIQWLHTNCSFKTVRLSAIDIKPTTLLQHHSEVVVFMVDSRESIHYFRQAVTRYQSSTRQHRYLVVFQFNYKLRALENTFKDLAQRSIFNVVVILNVEFEERIFLYNPFDGTFNTFNDTAIAGEEKNRDVFLRDRSDLRGRSLVVSMHEQNDRALLKKNGRPGYSGVDGLIADLLEERMNSTFIYTTPHELYNGNKNSGVIGDLTLRDADMSFNADSLAPFIVSGTVDVTEPFERNDMCILVPKAGDEPTIYNLLRTLSKTTWMVTLFSVMAMMLIYRWTQDIQKFIHSNRYSFYEYSWTEISTIIFQSFFGDSITRIPVSMPLRILVIVWCVYSFLITNAFQAKLISSLVRPKGLNDIDTIEELGHSNFNIVYPIALANHIKEYTDNHTMSILKDQLLEVDSWSKFDATMNNRSQTAFVLMCFHADLMEKRMFDKTAGRPVYKIMTERLLTFPRVYFLKLGSMYVEYVSELLRRFHEMGFIVKWARYSEFENGLHGNVPVDDDEDDDVDEGNIKVVITTEHLQTSFYLLFIGLVAASIAFLGEKIYFRRMHNRHIEV